MFAKDNTLIRGSTPELYFSTHRKEEVLERTSPVPGGSLDLGTSRVTVLLTIR